MPSVPSPMAAAPTEAASSSSATPQVAQEWQYQPKVKATGWKNKLAWLIAAYQRKDGAECSKLCQLYQQDIDQQKSHSLSQWGHQTMTFCQHWQSQEWVALELHLQRYLGVHFNNVLHFTY